MEELKSDNWWREYLDLNRKKHLNEKEKSRLQELLLWEKLESEHD